MSSAKRCAACNTTGITDEHNCLESKYLRHYTNWLMFDRLDTMGHQLGYRVANVERHISYFQDYARAVSDMSKERTRLHKLVASALDIPHADFKPFEEDVIAGRPNYHLCLGVLMSAVTEELWKFTTIYESKGYSYAQVLAMKKKHLPNDDKYPDIYLTEWSNYE